MILIFEQDLTHYRVLFYEYLAEKVDEELLIIYGSGEPGAYHILNAKDKHRNFKTKEIRRKWFRKLIYLNSFSDIKKIFFENNVSCVIHRGAIRNIGLYREMRFFQKHGVPVILRGIGFSSRRDFNPKKSLADRYHQFIINTCDAYLCYTKGSKEVLDKWYDPRKIFVAVNTLNSQLLNKHYAQLEEIGKDKIKNKLGLSCSKYIIHVGRMSARKRLKDLIDIYSIIQNKHKDIGLILVGDGQERRNLENYVAKNDIKNVLFAGEISSENILVSKYIYVADVFLITGNIGLSINHAFLLGTPVVGFVLPKGEETHIEYVQTPEYEYLVDDYNGFVVNKYDLNAFSNAVELVLVSDKLAYNAYSYAQDHLTVEAMAQGYLNSISYVKKDIRNEV